MTIRLSNSSFAGTARTLVAVGTCSDCCMFETTRAAAPRSGVDPAPLLSEVVAAVSLACVFVDAAGLLSVGLPAGLPSVALV